MMTFQFRIQIMGITKPLVWRWIEMDADTSFEESYGIIQYAFGWEFVRFYLSSEKGFRSPFQIQDPALANDGIGKDGDSTKIKLRTSLKRRNRLTSTFMILEITRNTKSLWKKFPMRQSPFRSVLPAKGNVRLRTVVVSGLTKASKRPSINEPEHPDHEEFREWFGSKMRMFGVQKKLI